MPQTRAEIPPDARVRGGALRICESRRAFCMRPPANGFTRQDCSVEFATRRGTVVWPRNLAATEQARANVQVNTTPE